MAIKLQSVVRTLAPTKADNVPILLEEMTHTFTLAKALPIFIFFSGSFQSNSTNHGGTIACMVDGASDLEMRRDFLIGGASNPCSIAMQKFLWLAPGRHTVAIWWFTDGTGTLTAVGRQRSLTILEEELD
jgi:hypothetical protein